MVCVFIAVWSQDELAPAASVAVFEEAVSIDDKITVTQEAWNVEIFVSDIVT